MNDIGNDKISPHIKIVHYVAKSDICDMCTNTPYAIYVVTYTFIGYSYRLCQMLQLCGLIFISIKENFCHLLLRYTP